MFSRFINEIRNCMNDISFWICDYKIRVNDQTKSVLLYLHKELSEASQIIREKLKKILVEMNVKRVSAKLNINDPYHIEDRTFYFQDGTTFTLRLFYSPLVVDYNKFESSQNILCCDCGRKNALSFEQAAGDIPTTQNVMQLFQLYSISDYMIRSIDNKFYLLVNIDDFEFSVVLLNFFKTFSAISNVTTNIKDTFHMLDVYFKRDAVVWKCFYMPIPLLDINSNLTQVYNETHKNDYRIIANEETPII